MEGTETPTSQPPRASLANYIAIARPDHWFKNIFVLPGVAVAIAVGATFDTQVAIDLFLALLATSLIASANYTINEYLDAEFDRHHPIKSKRPSAQGVIEPTWVIVQWVVLSILGLGLGFYLGLMVGWTLVSLLFMGLVYNVNPVRSKDRPYFDVISESVNNPIRFLVGWFILAPTTVPPASILLSYWMGGAFLMAIKRYAEYRFIDDPSRAALYRRSFAGYSEATLLQSSFLYAILSSFFLGVFLIKYRMEFILSLPFFALLFVWYLRMGMRKRSVAQTPEKLYKEKRFLSFVGVLCIVVTFCFFVDIPWLEEFFVTVRAGQ